MFNAGQTCVSIERVYVVKEVYEAFLKKVLKEVKSLRVGPQNGSVADMGSMTTLKQIEILEQHIEDAAAKGAKVLMGGKCIDSSKGYFFEPTVIVDITPGMAIVEEESFGPIVAIQKVQDAKEAIIMANRSKYGLSASVWGNPKAAWDVASRLESGSVCLNDGLTNFMVPELPFGGIKMSGVGFRHGEHGIRRFTRSQSVLVSRFRPTREVVWYPYSERTARVIEKTLIWLYRSWFLGSKEA
jgi:acyl-CoA reductase-like NAD-dependent aldehyde dehydrogenase